MEIRKKMEGLEMDGNMIATIALLALLGYGFWCGWTQMTNGSGFLGGHFPRKALNWVNQKKVGPMVVKIGLSVAVAYIFSAIAIITLILKVLGMLARR